VGSQVKEKARELGMEIQFLREKLEEEVKRGVEALRSGLQSRGDVLKRINRERRSDRGDREVTYLTRRMWWPCGG
jgi:hypothetical protein